MTHPHRQHATEATADIDDLLASTRALLRAYNVRLATALALAARNGDLLETANIVRMPFSTANQLALWADLTVVKPDTDALPNPARDRADRQAQTLPTDEVPQVPGSVVIARVIHYAKVREININELIVNRIGPIDPDPSLSTILAYAEALGVPVAALVSGKVDDEPMPC